MIGTIDPSKRNAVVIGGGIAGLLAAYRLDRRGFEVTLYEAEERLGGLIRTENIEGFGISEHAAHSIRASQAVFSLLAELNVETIPLNPDSRKRFIFRGNKLRRFPLGPFETLETIGRVLFVPAKSSYANLAEWGERHLGRSATRHLLTTFTRGVFGTGPDELSPDAAFPKLCPQKGRSLFRHLIRGQDRKPGERARMIALRGGMQALIHALADKLQNRLGSRLHLGTRLNDIPEASNCVLAVPAHAAAQLLAKSDPALSRSLARVSYSGLLSVTTFAEKKSFSKKVQGVGVLMSPDSVCRCMGILFNSSSFSGRVLNDEAMISLTLLYPASTHLDILENVVRDDLDFVFGFDQSAELHLVPHLHPHAIPRYDRDLQEVWRQARLGWCSSRGRVLFGNHSGGLSLRAMIESSHQLGSPEASL